MGRRIRLVDGQWDRDREHSRRSRGVFANRCRDEREVRCTHGERIRGSGKPPNRRHRRRGSRRARRREGPRGCRCVRARARAVDRRRGARCAGELMAYLLSHFSAERVHSGASFLSEGVDRLYAGENVTLVDDYAHPLHASCPFDGEGTPTERVTLLENGVGRAFVTDTEWATRMKCRNTGHHGFGISFVNGPHVRNPVLMPGSRSRDDLIASTKHGMLITRFWYIRVVDQRKTIVTGMTRDGNFLI